MTDAEVLPPEQDVKLIVDMKAAFDSYSNAAHSFDIVEPKLKQLHAITGLAAETGEVLGKFQKIIRDQEGRITDEDRLAISQELGDVLWFIAAIARTINVPFHVIPLLNIEKLSSRRQRGTERGSGDNR